MNKQLSVTTTWTCDCGQVNSVSNRVCPKCGHSMPIKIPKRIYEEEVRIHNGILIDKKKCIPIITVVALIIVFHRFVPFVVSMLTGIVSLAFEWIYVWQSSKNSNIKKIQKLKKYVGFVFGFSMIMLVIIRITASEMKVAVQIGFMILFLGGIISFVAAIVFSFVAKKRNYLATTQNNIRAIASFYAPKLLCLAIIMCLV